MNFYMFTCFASPLTLEPLGGLAIKFIQIYCIYVLDISVLHNKFDWTKIGPEFVERCRKY